MPMSKYGKSPKPRLNQKKHNSSKSGGGNHYSFAHKGAIPCSGDFKSKGNVF